MRARTVKQHLLFLCSLSKIAALLPAFLTCIRQRAKAAAYVSVPFVPLLGWREWAMRSWGCGAGPGGF